MINTYIPITANEFNEQISALQALRKFGDLFCEWVTAQNVDTNATDATRAEKLRERAENL